MKIKGELKRPLLIWILLLALILFVRVCNEIIDPGDPFLRIKEEQWKVGELEACGLTEKALSRYQQFKWDVMATLPQSDFEIELDPKHLRAEN